MLSAISFGVFWRLGALDERDHAVEEASRPGCAVTRTTIWSERTRVPPVTAERSPPDSRITGADSPVMADSSTRRDALDHVAVGRDHLASGDDDDVAERELDARHLLERAVAGASLGDGGPRGSCGASSACALPAPSATASAKFAKSTVNHSQAATSPAKTFSWVPDESARSFTNRR